MSIKPSAFTKDLEGSKRAGHGSFTSVPVVDVAPLYSSVPEDRANAAKALDAAVRESGFFYAVGHRVPEVDRQGLIASARRFFSLPLETKMRWYIGNSKHHKGYVPEGEEVFEGGTMDRKEAFDLGCDLPEDDPDVLAGTPTLGPNVWPEVEGFRQDVQTYYRSAAAFGRVLFRGFALALGMEQDFFDHVITKPPSQLRLLHYPYNPDGADAPGIGAHTDYECFTILLPMAPGLEVLNGAGEWVDAPPLDGAFIVNIGDMMEIFTNGEYVATSHRVRSVREERYSFPMFCTCDYHTVVEPLPQFVGPGRPRRYEAISAGAHLLAQTAQSFSYLKRRIASGELVLPPGSRALSSFGREARYGSSVQGDPA
jgi:isopenicillin N synthase-like dioxygenase